MASFPSAAAQFSAQRQDPLEQYGRVVALQNLMRNQQFQQQMQPLQLQQAQQQVQQGQMSLRSQQAIQKAVQESPGDPDKMVQLAWQYGALPQDLLALQSHFLDVREKLANTSKAELTNSLARHDQARSLIQGVLSAPPEDQPQLYAQAIAQARQQHLLDDIPPNAIPAEFPGADKLKQFGDGLALASTLTKEALEQAQTAHALAETAQLEPFTEDRVDQLNQGLQSIWQTIHPGQPAPGWAQLQSGATFKDFERVNKLLDTTVQTQATQAQRDTANAVRAQTLQVANQAADETNYQHSVAQLNTVGKPVAELMSRFSRLQDTIAQGTPQADALVAPELLTVMAGGQGSGLRMNEAEIARIIGGRSKWESLRAAVQKWSLNPETANSITPDQRQQIRSLVKAVGDKLQAKQAAIEDAHQALLGTNKPSERRAIVGKAQQELVHIDQNPTAPTPPAQQNQSGAFDWNAHPVVKP